MHKLRLEFSPEETDSDKRLNNAMVICKEVMNIIFKGKPIDIIIKFWNAKDWKVAQTMLTVYDTINLSKSSEIKNTIKNGRLTTIDVLIEMRKYEFDNIKDVLYMSLSSELGIHDHIDMSVEFASSANIIFSPYDDRGANIDLQSKKLYFSLLKSFKNYIIESYYMI